MCRSCVSAFCRAGKTDARNARRKAALIYRMYGTDEETGAGTLTDEKRVRNGVLDRMCGKQIGLVQTVSAYFKQDGRRERTERAARIFCTGRVGRPKETGARTLTDEKRVQNGVLDRMCGKMMCEIG